MQTLMRKAWRFSAALIVVVFALNPVAWAQGDPSADQPVATVNSVDIARHDLDSEILELKMEMDFRNRSLSNLQIQPLRSQLLETLIERELLYQKARERNLQVRDRWVDRAIDQLKIRLKGHAVSMQDYLASINTTEEQLRERVRKGLMIQRVLRREVLRQIKVSET
ncbi:MAG: SurA N-terminal domain-containing protein, partial [Desulfosarcinaceae bacterium]